MIRELNASGLTASGGSCPAAVLPIFRMMAREGRLNKRFFCLVSAPMGNNADTVTKNLPRIAELRSQLFQGDLWIDHFAYGEQLHSRARQHGQRRGQAAAGEPRAVGPHRARARESRACRCTRTRRSSILRRLPRPDRAINKEFPVRNLRWALIHGEQLTATQLERMRNLGVHAAVQPRATIMGGIFNRVHGDRSYDMPPLSTIQESGVIWGLGTDAFEVNQYRPFTTLYFAVTGKMVGGDVANRQPISREDALIAHTRRNAFRPAGKQPRIDPGGKAGRSRRARPRLPDDSCRPDQGHRPVMTMVGGRVVYETALTR